MTTVITRLYAEKGAAQSAASKLQEKGLPRRAVQVISASGGGDLQARMVKAMVDQKAATIYGKKLKGDAALLVVRATYKPLGAAVITRETLAKTDTVDVGKINDDYWMPDGPQRDLSILEDHPRFFTRLPTSANQRGGLVTPQFGMKLLSKRKDRKSAISGGRFMSRMFWPTPLLKRNRKARSVMRNSKPMSTKFWPMPFLSPGQRRISVIPGGGPVFSKALGLPLITLR